MAHRLVLDVSSLMYRAHFAMGDGVRSPSGRSVGAVHGYLDMVTRLIVSRRPEEVVHAYDHEWRPVAARHLPRIQGEPSARSGRPARAVHDAPTGARPHRHGAGDDRGWEPRTRSARSAPRRSDDLLEMVSGDRDLIQLVRDPVGEAALHRPRRLRPARARRGRGARALRRSGRPLRGVRDPARRPQRRPARVRGVGEKTARALVQTYGSLESS